MSRSGCYKSNLTGDMMYQSFLPNILPPNPALHNKNITIIADTDTRTGILKKLFAHLEQTPIIDIKQTAVALGSAYNTTSTAVKKLMELGVLVQVNNSKRERTFAYEEYLAILRKDT